MKALTFHRPETFTIDVHYADVSDSQTPAKISHYMIGPFQSTNGEYAKLKVKVRLNLHGIVSIESATVEAPEKKVTKKAVPVSGVVYGALASSDLQKAVEKEFVMALQDRVMEETEDKKNAVEAYVYDMRKKVCRRSHDKYHDFVTESEREQFITKLQEVEDWLYEDGEDAAKGVYVAKLEELKKQGDPIEERYKEHTERGFVIDQFIYCVASYRGAAMSPDPKFDHIDLAEKQKVLVKCVEAEAWLREKKQQQDTLPKHANPVLLTADVKKKAEALDRICRPIMTKPKPTKPATPEPTSQGTLGNPIEERYEEQTERGSVIDQLDYCFTEQMYYTTTTSSTTSIQHQNVEESSDFESGVKRKMEEFYHELSKIVGLHDLKKQLQRWAKGMFLDEKRRAMGIDLSPRKTPHMAFLGNPGTGKTTVAKILGNLLCSVGALSSNKVTEVQRSDLVGEFIGHTGPKTRKKIEEALGGILFVEEAYRLTPADKSNDFGVEALEEIMSVLEDGQILVIFAGYTEPMKRVFSSNEGFCRRVTHFFQFDDFSCKDLAEMVLIKMRNQDEKSRFIGFKLHSACTLEAVVSVIERNSSEKLRRRMNGGLVDHMLSNARENLDSRLSFKSKRDDLLTITLDDLEAGLRVLAKRVNIDEDE